MKKSKIGAVIENTEQGPTSSVIPVLKKKDAIKKKRNGNSVPKRIVNDGLEEVTVDDLFIPRFKLLQPLSKILMEEGFSGRAGQFVNTLTKECIDKFYFIPLQFSKYVIERDIQGKVAEIYMCNALLQNREMCNERWHYNISEAEQKKYTLVYSIIALKIEEDINDADEIVNLSNLFIMNFVKTNIAKAKQILTVVKLSGQNAKTPRPYLCNFIFADSSEKKTNDKGTWYVHKPVMFRFTPEDIVERALSLIACLKQDAAKDAVKKEGQEYADEAKPIGDDIPF